MSSTIHRLFGGITDVYCVNCIFSEIDGPYRYGLTMSRQGYEMYSRGHNNGDLNARAVFLRKNPGVRNFRNENTA